MLETLPLACHDAVSRGVPRRCLSRRATTLSLASCHDAVSGRSLPLPPSAHQNELWAGSLERPQRFPCAHGVPPKAPSCARRVAAGGLRWRRGVRLESPPWYLCYEQTHPPAYPRPSSLYTGAARGPSCAGNCRRTVAERSPGRGGIVAPGPYLIYGSIRNIIVIVFPARCAVVGSSKLRVSALLTRAQGGRMRGVRDAAVRRQVTGACPGRALGHLACVPYGQRSEKV